MRIIGYSESFEKFNLNFENLDKPKFDWGSNIIAKNRPPN